MGCGDITCTPKTVNQIVTGPAAREGRSTGFTVGHPVDYSFFNKWPEGLREY
jgi:hypothetical protein